MSLLNLIKNVVKNVQQKNAKNPNVKTAHASVFDNVVNKIPAKEAEVSQQSQNDLLEQLLNNIEETRIQNEADANVETADASVFEEMQREISELKAKVATYEERPTSSVNAYKPPTEANPLGLPLPAITNSNRANLQMYSAPEMGASMIQNVFIPDLSKVTVLQYSDTKIILDGQETNFALIDYNGARGWVLDFYLNMN